MPLDVETDVVVETALPPGLDVVQIEALVPFVLAREGAAGRWQVAIALTDDAHLQALHRDFMGSDTVTDVMTFPLSEEPVPGQDQGGDVVVSVERAVDQAPAFGTTPADEVLYLITHGLLHLLGWTDETEAQRTAMLERQTALLDAFGQEPAP